MCSITGTPSTGTIGFGTSYVKGRSLVPRPAARSIALLKGRCSGSLVPAREVLRLLGRELVDRDAHRLELQLRDLLVDLGRKHVHLPVEVVRVLRQILGRERLVGEAHVHHGRGMALARGGGDGALSPAR